MWKAERTSYGGANDSGDVEMVPSSAVDTFDDEDDGVGFSMTGGIKRPKSGGRNKGYAKFLCCLLLALLSVVGLVLAYVYGPQFGLLTGGSNSESDEANQHAEVSPDSIVNNDAYDIILQVPVPTVEGDLILYEHKITKTPVMTILPYDTKQDSVFGITFRTKPSNSHGAPHVLEHSVLTGSKKYPLKDPFTQVLKGSLQTYVNAMTWDDLTGYVCSSRNDVDMKNLMSVYLDAVFAPLVIEEEGKWIFRQEGWRVEMGGNEGEPEYNGVVLNEMKGATSDPDDILAEHSKAQIFFNTTYRFNSGGEPSVIPQLSHRELKDFYTTFYHPSNAQVFLFGTKASAENLLENLDEYLKTYQPKPEIRQQSKIELQPLVDIQPTKQRVPYSSDSEDAKHQLMMSWLISGSATMDDAFQKEFRVCYSVLSYLLMNEKTGVLYRALQDSGMVGKIDGGIEKGLQQWTLDIALSSINQTDIGKVEELVQSTLEHIAKRGFDKQDIDVAMNQVQFSNRDLSTDDDPRGIVLWYQVMDTWKFDLQPLTGFLSFEQDFEALQKRLKSRHGADLFVQIIKENVLNNKHRVVIDLYPDPKLTQRIADEEKSRLVKLRQSQSFPGLLDEAEAMSEKQVSEEPANVTSLIPSVSVADLAKKGDEPSTLIDEDREGSGVTVLIHEVPSSFDNVYVDLGLDVSMVDFKDIVLLPLLARLMVDGAGTQTYKSVELARQIGKSTGGIEEEIVIQPILPANTTMRYKVPDGDHFHSKLFLRGAAMKEKAEKLFELLTQMMFHANLDSQERALGILRERVTDFEQQLIGGGMKLAAKRLRARYTTYKFVEESIFGVSALTKLREILKSAETDWQSVLARLTKMQQAILKGNRNGMALSLTGEMGVLKHVAPRVSHCLLNHFPDRSQETSPLPNFATVSHPWVEEAKNAMATDSPIRNEGLVIEAKVNFVGAGAPFFESHEEISGSTEVICQYVEYNNFMLQIRERRGAYGAYVMCDKWTGQLLFMSYRDPNLSETLTVYKEVPNYLKDQMADPDKVQPLLNSAIVGSIGSLDGVAPQPNSAGWESLMQWYRGSTPVVRQNWREDILSTTTNDILKFAERLEKWQPTLAIAGPKTTLEQEDSLSLTLIDLL